MSDKFFDNALDTLDTSIDSDDTAVILDDASEFPAVGPYRIKIDNELMLVASKSSNTLTVTRGVDGTTAASHTSGADVAGVLCAGGLNSILNGSDNIVGAPRSQILAGDECEIPTNEFSQNNAIAGGYQNEIVGGQNCVIAGGGINTIQEYYSNTATGCVIVGGGSNTIIPGFDAGVQYSVIAGGIYNSNKGDRCVILGGSYNAIEVNAKDTVVIGNLGYAGASGVAYRNALVHGHYLFGGNGEAQFERHFSGCNATSSSTFAAFTSTGETTHITLPPGYFATGTVKAIGVGTDGSTYHRILSFSAANLGFGASMLDQGTTYTYDYGTMGPTCALTANYDYIHANCTGSDSYNVKWFLCWEFVRVNQMVSGSTS